MHALLRSTLCASVVLCLIGSAAVSHADEDGDFSFAEHLLRDGMYDLASSQLQLYIENHPDSPRTPDAFLLLADAYVESESFARAADTYQGFIIKYPQDVRVRDLWGKQAGLRSRAGQYAAAARDYLQLADAYPESDFADDALLGAAGALVSIGEGERAERSLTRLLTRYPDGNSAAPARVLLGQVLLARGDAAGAEQAIRSVLSNRTLTDHVADGLELGVRVAIAQGKTAEGRRLSDRLVAQAPGDARTWRARMALGRNLLHAGETSGEMELLNQAADLFREASRRGTTAAFTERALFDLARVRELQGSASLALSNWEDFLRRYPVSPLRPKAMLGLGRAHLSAGNEREGVFALEELLSTYPDSSESNQALGELGENYLRRGDGASAISYFEQQTGDMPAGDERRKRRLEIAAIRAEQLDETDEARAIYRELSTGEGAMAAEALFGLARMERRAGDLDNAEEAYSQVARRFPGHELATAARDSLTMIRHFLRPNLPGAMVAMISLDAAQLISGSSDTDRLRERKLGLAQIRIAHLKDYSGSIVLLESYLADENPDSPEVGEHLLAQCHLRLATRAKLTSDLEAEASAREHALAALARLAERYPDSELADDAFIETTEAGLNARSDADPAAVVEAYRDFLTRYPASDRRDFVLVRLAESAVAGAADGVGTPTAALRQFEEALAYAPDGDVLDRALFGSALILKGQGRADESLVRLGRLIAERPLSRLVPESRYQIALIHSDQGRSRAAARELQKLLHSGEISRDPDHIRRKLITAYDASGSYGDIVPIARQMTESQDGDASAFGARSLAGALIELRRLEEAVSALADEVAARPDAADADSLTILRARLLGELNHPSRIMTTLTGFERRFPRSRYVPVAWRMLANVQLDLESYEEALASYRRVLQADERDGEARLGEVITLYRLGRADEARPRERTLRDATTLSIEDEIRLSLEEGHALFRARDFLGAIEAFARVAQENPESQWADDALLAQGRAAARSGRIEPAVVAFEKLLREHPESTLRQEAAFELANAYFGTRFYEQAAAEYARTLEMGMSSRFAAEAMWQLARSYEFVQRLDSAIRTLRQFLMQFPGHERVPRVRLKIAEDLNKLGEFADAVTAYEEALDNMSGEGTSDARYGLAEAHFNLGNYERAIVEWLKMAYHGQTQSRWAVTALYRAGKANERLGRNADAARLYEKIVVAVGESSDLGRTAALQLIRLNEADTGGNGATP